MLDPLIGVMIKEHSDPQGAPDSSFLRELCVAGRSFGMTVFVFTPGGIEWTTPSVEGFILDPEGRWNSRKFPLPHAVYNRCFSGSRRQYRSQAEAIRKLKQHGTVIMNIGLSGKWDVYRALRSDPNIGPHLPETRLATGASDVRRWFELHDQAFLKPHSGSQGKSTVQITRSGENQYTVKARTDRNREIHRPFQDLASLSAWIGRWIGSRKFLIQPNLQLSSSFGSVYDIRALVQKSGDGRWRMTGMVVRLGAPGSATSNLHGGGSAAAVEPFLQREFGDKAAGDILSRLQRLADLVPPAVESRFGRLCELGLDFGIDRGGRVWLLEVNSKPGRAVFRKLGMHAERRQAVINPLLYASYLLNHRPYPLRPANRPKSPAVLLHVGRSGHHRRVPNEFYSMSTAFHQ
jgi:hypothetical protein